MKAAVMEDIGDIKIKNVSKPEIDSDFGLLIEVKSCAVCGSDLRIFRHGNERVQMPQIVGHEAAGEVVEVGDKIERFNIGDRVAVGADIPCGKCIFCRDGRGNECETNNALGYQFQGGFAEYLPLNRMTVQFGPVHKIPEDVSYSEASLAEPLGCCINGFEVSPINIGDVVVIIGAGPIGCLLVQLAKYHGASKVILAELSAERLEKAKKFGADLNVLSSQKDLQKVVMKETDNLGAHQVFTACPSKKAQEQGIKLLRNGGMINFFGGLPDEAGPLNISSNEIHYKQIYLTGSHGSVPRQHRIALNMIASGRIEVEKLITHTFSLDEIEEAFSVVENKEGLKVIVKP